MNLTAWLYILSSFISAAWSSDIPVRPAPEPSPSPKIARMEMRNGAAHFVFWDGREAAVSYALGKKVALPMHLRQIENTCLPMQRQARCTLMSEVFPFEVSLRWTVNPNPEKINTVVKFTSGDQSSEFKSVGIPLFRFGQTQEFLSLFNRETLECDNWDWFENLPHENDIYNLASWTSEAMVATPETGLNENQGISALYGMKFQKQGTRAVLVDYGIVSRSPFIPVPYFSQQMINLQYEAADGRPCQVGFEADSSALINYVQSPDAKKVDLTNLKLLRQNVESLNLSELVLLSRLLIVRGVSGSLEIE